ncbi:MAG TPA: citrate synthase [Pseudolysinimonas sp.]|jgi:citrate synthase
MEGNLDSTEAARRLGVKVSTLYAYVSRGLISSVRDPDSRMSVFAIEDVEELARRSRGGRSMETRVATITTSVTHLTSAGPLYRGTPAISLIDEPFEKVAHLLWRVPAFEWQALEFDMPRGGSASELLRAAIPLIGALDPVRSDQRRQAVTRAVSTVIATLARRIPEREAVPSARAPLSVSDLLAYWLAGSKKPSAALVRATNATCVLLADNELAPSTFGVRLAASTRADIYDALIAGLGVLGGTLGGANSEIAARLLLDAKDRGASRAIDDHIRTGATLPGFGGLTYPDGDPRFAVMLPLLNGIMTDAQRAIVTELLAVARERDFPEPNMYLAVGLLVFATGAPVEAGSFIFGLSRIPGWTAHYLEELREPALRFRARAVYATSRE